MLIEANKNRNNYLVIIFYNKLKFPALSPCETGGEKDGNFQFVVEIAHKAFVVIMISL